MARSAPSLRPALRPTLLGLGLGFALALVAGIASWRLVRADAQRAEAAGVVKRGPYAFVGGAAALAAGLGFLLGRRLGRGRAVQSTGWILTTDRVVPQPTTYRAAESPSIGLLIDRLAVLGYDVDACHVGGDGVPGAPAEGAAPLVGGAYWLRDPRLGPAGTGVEVRISADADRDAGGRGSLRAVDAARSDANGELAQFAIVELGALLPGLRYLADDSRLSPDPVEVLRAALPERPRRR